ncbi:MAG: PEGA domain-containing protein, partial [Myxococcales bacterium]|nr:PEGA domain-containing protein [Myxococcales bacterium]
RPGDPVRARRPTQPERGRMLPASTMTLDAADLDLEEMTAISSGPPGFESAAHDAPTKNTTAAPSGGLDYGDYEPTVIESGARDSGAIDHEATTGTYGELEPADADDGPTVTRDGAGVPLPQPVSLSSSETMPRPSHDLRSRIRPGAPAHPALMASTPTPAVSELRKPRGSRRTPPGGLPATGSVLQSLVGRGPGEPMPTVPLRVSSDGVPQVVPDQAPSGAPTAPQGGYGAGLIGTVPGQHALPTVGGPPTMPGTPSQGFGPSQLPTQPGQPGQPMALVAPPTPLPGALPNQAAALGAQLPPHLVPYGLPPSAQVVSPYPMPQAGSQPYPYGPPGMTFTKQMQAALDVDEIPRQYKLDRGTSSRLLWVLVGMLLVIGAVGATVFFLRESSGPAAAALVIESVPSGAEVTIDGDKLGETTPARFSTRPGARHEVRVTLPRYKPWTDTLVVSGSGGDVKVVAVLTSITGKLRINSAPGGAEVWLNGRQVGVTPTTLDVPDPAEVTEVELRHKDFGTVTQPVVWDDNDTASIDVKFRK